MQALRIADHISGWLKDYCARGGLRGFVVGVSGGIDSALVSTLCARTGLSTVCVEMPIHQAPSQVQRAQDHIAWLRQRHANVSMHTVDLTTAFETLVANLPQHGDEALKQLSLANTRARLRMATLYHIAGTLRSLVVGTGNKVEDFGVGFFTKYGDGGVDLSPIADLMKTEVYEVAGALGIIESIMSAKPTDGLFGDNRSDEDQIGASYPELEWAMRLRDRGHDPSPLQFTSRQREVLAIFDHRRAANRHKIEPIPVCVIPAELRQ